MGTLQLQISQLQQLKCSALAGTVIITSPSDVTTAEPRIYFLVLPQYCFDEITVQ